jgi:signal transduction histidine kinase
MSTGLAQPDVKQRLRGANKLALPIRLVDPPSSNKRADSIRGTIQDDLNVKSARLKVARLLLNAQEAERSRVARELHDDIGQAIAILSMDLQRTAFLLKGKSKEGDAQLKDLQDRIKFLGNRVKNLSHQLHPSALEYLGLAAAANGFCNEFCERSGIQVAYECIGISQGLSTDIALNFFRVLQEALRNVMKHSQADQVEVALYETGGYLCLTIADNGEGFDSDQAFENPGLGLTSMRERMCLLGGSFEIRSKPGIGTTIDARVPLLNIGRMPQ